jgi:RNA polymerase sigma-70 factor, ECF subfamily
MLNMSVALAHRVGGAVPQRAALCRSGPLNDFDGSVDAAVSAAQAGDHDAVRALYAHYRARVERRIACIVRDAHAAEDLTQDVFVKVMTVIDRYEPRGVPFTSWIMCVARNVALDHLRRRRAEPVERVVGEWPPCDERDDERRRDLCEALGRLSDEQRCVFVLRHLVGLRPEEVAVRVGKSSAAVHGLEQRARRRMRAELVRAHVAPVVA